MKSSVTPTSKVFRQQSKPSMITTEQAIYMLGHKISVLANKFSKTTNVLETKLGNHENYVTENLPDLECFNNAFSDINKRLLDLESLHERITILESNANIKPPPSKKKSTLKMNELTDGTPPPSFAPGISFS
uniref:Uncharacterized protein n=1 Tax=viral metagenome TaxID=1070528 RepID=A0A6C0B800_9ZZZZ